MALTNISELCRLCLEESDQLYKLDSDFCILVMESGSSITISDALKYLNLDIKIPPLKPNEEPEKPKVKTEEGQEAEKDEAEPEEATLEDQSSIPDDPQLPKSMCQECLEKMQSAYEFKYRVEENKVFLKNYLKECADARLAEERAAKEAALRDLNVDLDNLDSLPDKLVLKDLTRHKKPRKPRDPNKPKVQRKPKAATKNVIIAEDSQVESPLYVRKLITTPEQSPDTSKHASKRKSKHVVIEDVFVGTKPEPKKPAPKLDDMEFEDDKLVEIAPKKKKKQEKIVRNDDEPNVEDEVPKKKKKQEKIVRNDDEPIFEEDVEPEKRKRGRPRKIDVEKKVVKEEKTADSGKKKKKKAAGDEEDQ